MNGLDRFAGLDDWQVVCQFLPPGWEDAARTHGALRRARGIPDAGTLLRTLLVHLADGCSLRETALRASQAEWCSVSPVALFKRLRSSEQWLRWLAERMWRRFDPPAAPDGVRVRVVDATTVQEFGSTSCDWRVHFALDLATLQCDHFELTDARGGETFRRIPVAAGDLLLGDRGYGTAPGIAHVVGRGGHLLVRVNHRLLRLHDAGGRRVAIRQRLRSLRVGQVGDWPAWVHVPDRAIPGRLVAVRLGRLAARAARARRTRFAHKKQRRASAEAVFLAGYVFVWTDLPADRWAAARLLDLYRLRWQIELVFKRMKSILGVGRLPKRSDPSCRAWLHGKLFLALLVDRLLGEAERFSPWGYRLGAPPQPVA